ncbi:hypothetical protein G5714_024687 [Onychostoma macrolepis]|uniref:Uncharacterized protein n=1 Tax=Onychostoma macrolepis TaxID=369639 RepID=A0A7J6BHI9_9TELE|nr:hypothetical protein G5714_024687 [Onychostoma macrolepis]
MKAKLQGLFERRQAQRHASWRLSSRGFSSDARPRNTPRWWGGHYPSALLCLSVTVKAKLQGLFERRQAQTHVSLVGWALPQRPLLRLSVTVTAKLQGLFRATPGPDTRLAGGVGTTPAPLVRFSVTVTAKLQGLFERRQAQRHVSLAGGHYPSALLCLSVTVKAKLQGLFERRHAQRHASLAGGQYIDAPHSRN